MKKKKSKAKRKWNRVGFFQQEKKPKGTKGEQREHPAWIFGQSGSQYKSIVFTSNATTAGKDNVKLKHNVDPDSKEPCYGVPYRGVRMASEFQPPKKKYRIHKDDVPVVKVLKAGQKKKK